LEKHLGRGLGEVSDFFLSSNEVEDNEESGVKEWDTTPISRPPDYQNYGAASQGKGMGVLPDNQGQSSREEGTAEIEETTNIHRKMAYPNSEDGQRNLKKALFRHLEQGFILRHIELGRTDITSTERSRKRKEETVTLYVKM
jgi:hypothetical protein